MLEQAFARVAELKKAKKFNFDDGHFKLAQVDCHDLPFSDSSFDTVVDTMSLQSYYDMNTVLSEMKRVCKSDGQLLIIARGLSKFSLYNKYLQFKAAKELLDNGQVEHLDFQKIIENTEGLELIHSERKNMGMTYIYILKV